MRKYINAALSLASVGLLFYIIYNQRQQIKSLKAEIQNVETIKIERDSLQSEIFTKDIQIGSYEHVLDLLETELNPDCKAKVEELKGQTE